MLGIRPNDRFTPKADISTEYPEKVEEMVALWEQYSEDNSVLDISYDLSDAVE